MADSPEAEVVADAERSAQLSSDRLAKEIASLRQELTQRLATEEAGAPPEELAVVPPPAPAAGSGPVLRKQGTADVSLDLDAEPVRRSSRSYGNLPEQDQEDLRLDAAQRLEALKLSMPPPSVPSPPETQRSLGRTPSQGSRSSRRGIVEVSRHKTGAAAAKEDLMRQEVAEAREQLQICKSEYAAQDGELLAKRKRMKQLAQETQEVRAKLVVAESESRELKQKLLQQVDLFDDAIARADAEVKDDSELQGKQQRIHRPGRWSLEKPWDWSTLDLELKGQLDAVKGSVRRGGDERQRLQEQVVISSREMQKLDHQLDDVARVHRELQAQAQRDRLFTQRGQGSEEKQLTELEVRLRDEEAARCEIEEKSAAEARRRNALQTSSADRHGGLQRRLQELEQQSQLLADEYISEVSQVEELRVAAATGPNEEVRLALQQRDAAVWSLNEQLLEVWAQEESTMQRVVEETNEEAALRAELQSKRDVVSGAEAEEQRLHMAAEHSVQRLLDLTSGEAADLAEGPLVNEVRQLEAELEAAYNHRAPLPEAHAALISDLEAMHRSLVSESAEQRTEVAAFRRSMFGHREVEAPVSRAFMEPNSGYRRALSNWDSIFGDPAEAPGGDAEEDWPARRWDEDPEPQYEHPEGSRRRAPPPSLPQTPASFLAGSSPLHGPRTGSKAVGQALDTLDAFARGRATRQQAEGQFGRLSQAQSVRAAQLAMQREQLIAGARPEPAQPPPRSPEKERSALRGSGREGWRA